jgi:hypothetical protein
LGPGTKDKAGKNAKSGGNEREGFAAREVSLTGPKRQWRRDSSDPALGMGPFDHTGIHQCLFRPMIELRRKSYRAFFPSISFEFRATDIVLRFTLRP